MLPGNHKQPLSADTGPAGGHFEAVAWAPMATRGPPKEGIFFLHIKHINDSYDDTILSVTSQCYMSIRICQAQVTSDCDGETNSS